MARQDRRDPTPRYRPRVTVVDTRRSSGRPATARRAEGRWPDPLAERDVDHPDVGPAHRPGALGAWAVGLLIALVGVGVGTGLSAPLGSVALAAFAVACVLSAGSVRRGLSLRRLVLTLPLVFVAQLVVGAVVEAGRGGSAVTTKAVGMTTAEVAVLHAPYLWGGMALAAFVGLRRGMFARSRPPR